MEVRLLGPVEVHADDGQLPVRGPIQRALVAMLPCHQESLAIHRGQGHHGDALASLRESLTIRQELGDAYGQAESLRELGMTLRELDRPQEAQAHWRQALAIFERLQTGDADQVRALLAARPPQGEEVPSK